MKKPSAGILVYRKTNGGVVEILLGHPGGPFWAKKDFGSWSVPKGEFEEGESPLDAAKREFLEETGHQTPTGDYIDLGMVVRSDGKVIHVWAIMGDLEVNGVGQSTFEMEWPPKSGKTQRFPEIDRIEWIPLAKAGAKMHHGQAVFIERLASHLGVAVEPYEPAAPISFSS